MKKLFLLTVFVCMLASGVFAVDNPDILSRLTIEEKTKLLTGMNGMMTQDYASKGVRALRFSDGPLGPHSNLELQVCFPNPCILANTFNKDLMRKVGESMGRLCNQQQIDMLLGPGVNIKRTPLCGRNFEYFSEDPVLAGEMAAELVKGVQSRGVAVSVKHFFANNIEFNRGAISSDMDMRTAHEIYLKPFEIVVKKARPLAIMCSYNKINDVWASENKWLLTDVLRGEWGFDGMVVSDWGAVHSRPACFKAGLDLQMPDDASTPGVMQKALENGEITEAEMDVNVDRIISLVRRINNPGPSEDFDIMAEHQVAADAAAEGMVLLKNSGALPITPDKFKKVAVFGTDARKMLLSGSGSAYTPAPPERIDDLVDMLNKYGNGVQFDYKDRVFPGGIPTFDHGMWNAFNNQDLAGYDAFIFVVSTGNTTDGEAYDRTSINFDSRLEAMLMHFTGRPNTIVVMQSGSAVAPVFDWYKKANSIVHAGIGGEAAGTALARLLTGDANFSGKLSETFAWSLNDNPVNEGIFSNSERIKYSEGIFAGYRWYDANDKDVWYPFGYGLSYTTFEYSDLQIKDNKVSFKIRNTGDRAGAEAAQVYVQPIDSQNSRPVRELKDFVKVYLEPGEEKTVSVTYNSSWFTYYSNEENRWVRDTCKHLICVGASSRDIRLSKEL